jgi:hypothetical protein
MLLYNSYTKINKRKLMAIKHLFRSLCFIGTLSSAILLASCGGGAAGGSATPGVLGVSITDAPSCGYDAVNVTVKKIRIHKSSTATDSDSGWTDISLAPARKINLLNLTNGVLDFLGQTPLSAGHYTQLRLVLDTNNGTGMANTVVLSGTVAEISLDTPSGVQSGIKLINSFDVQAGMRTDLVLDFDACKSIVTTGNGGYALKPVINVIPTVLNGIDGFVNLGLLNSHVMVTAQQNGTIARATIPNPLTGEFYLARLAPGNYDVVITADNYATAVVMTVPVLNQTSTSFISTAIAPINLQAAGTAPGSISGTAILNPASTTEVAYVSAKQSFASGPTFTVKYTGANLTDGTYILNNLPTVAPQLAQYSAFLPLTFVTRTNTIPGTGKYAVEAIATGYTTQTNSSVDITSANQTAIDFTLLP